MKTKKGIFLVAALLALAWIIWTGCDSGRYRVSEQFSQDDFFVGTEDADQGGMQFEPGFYFDSSMDGTALYSRELPLKKGVYEISVLAQTNNGGRECCAEAVSFDDASGREHAHLIDSDAIELKNEVPAVFRIHVNHDAAVRIMLTAGEAEQTSYVLLEQAQIVYLAGRTMSWRLSGCIAFFAAVLLLLWLLLFQKDRTMRFASENAYAIAAIAGSVLIAMYPFTNHLMIFGDDLLYHFNRIVHLGEGFKNGVFPVRIHPGWAGEYGYAAGVGYCDLFLVPSAVMYQMGYTLSGAYRFYVLLMTVLTAVCSEYAFRRISGDRLIGAVCCAVYTLFPYRIFNVYSRATVGEYGAYTFLPLIVLGLYDIYLEKEQLKKGWIILAAGISCVIETHVLTVFILAFMIPVFCILLWKKTFTKEVFTALCKALAAVVAVNLWFLLPLADYLLMQGFAGSWKVYLWDNGFDTPGLLFNLRDKTGYSSGMIGSGVIVVFVLAVCCVMLCKEAFGRYNAAMGALWGASILLLYMSTASFPYWSMHKVLPAADRLLSTIQFPYRLLGPAAVIIVFLLAFCGRTVLEKNGKQSAYMLAGALLVLSLYQPIEYLTNVVNDGHMFTAYDEARVGSGAPAEFLLKDAALSVVSRTSPEALSKDTAVSVKERVGTHITAHITNSGDKPSVVLFPLWSYRYYTAKAEGRYLSVGTSEDKRIAVEIPAGFDSDVEVFFKEPLLWRLSEILSVIALVYLIILIRKEKRSLIS